MKTLLKRIDTLQNTVNHLVEIVGELHPLGMARLNPTADRDNRRYLLIQAFYEALTSRREDDSIAASQKVEVAFDLAARSGWNAEEDQSFDAFCATASEQEILCEALRISLTRCTTGEL